MLVPRNEAPTPQYQESTTDALETGSLTLMRDHLLSQVLSETLERQREDPTALIRAIREWSETTERLIFDESVCCGIVAQVLGHRLGNSIRVVPDVVIREIGAVLWAKVESRRRIERLWTAIRGPS